MLKAEHDDQKAAIDALNQRLAAAEHALEQRRAEVLAITQTVAAAQAMIESLVIITGDPAFAGCPGVPTLW